MGSPVLPLGTNQKIVLNPVHTENIRFGQKMFGNSLDSRNLELVKPCREMHDKTRKISITETYTMTR